MRFGLSVNDLASAHGGGRIRLMLLVVIGSASNAIDYRSTDVFSHGSEDADLMGAQRSEIDFLVILASIA
jgi:hypothetical protein